MNYLGSPYRLRPVEPDAFREKATQFFRLQHEQGLTEALRRSAGDYDLLSEAIVTYGEVLQELYREGGGLYGLALGAGLTALRAVNPTPDTPLIKPRDWETTIDRERELTRRPRLGTVEAISGVGLLELMGVNPGYVDGYQTTFDRPRLNHLRGFSGLGVLHAHDLMHFASARA
ncbi:MAG TPA: hypothetical protein VLG37_02530 [Candidatus Saccharimonadales bacterium]|nr:hypothetical protein [Candidatus Saccharimonadales bacterium]